MLSLNGEEKQKVEYDLKLKLEDGRETDKNEFWLVPTERGLSESIGTVGIQHKNRLIWTIFEAPYPVVFERDVPANAVKPDITLSGGEFTFGYSTHDKPNFNAFDLHDFPYQPGNITIERLNAKGQDPWLSYAQNTSDEASDGKQTMNVFYPAKSEGSGVLHPGPKKGDVAKMRFTAKDSAEYHFEITAELIAKDPTGVGVRGCTTIKCPI